MAPHVRTAGIPPAWSPMTPSERRLAVLERALRVLKLLLTVVLLAVGVREAFA